MKINTVPPKTSVDPLNRKKSNLSNILGPKIFDKFDFFRFRGSPLWFWKIYNCSETFEFQSNFKTKGTQWLFRPMSKFAQICFLIPSFWRIWWYATLHVQIVQPNVFKYLTYFLVMVSPLLCNAWADSISFLTFLAFSNASIQV